jgi:hypothetical protein
VTVNFLTQLRGSISIDVINSSHLTQFILAKS